MNCVADDLHRRPLADRGSPGRTHGNAVINPRIRVCSTVVLTVLPPALRNRFIPSCPDLVIGTAQACSKSLTTNIRVYARQLALQPHLQSYADLVDHFCAAWNKFIDQPWRIMSIGLRQWAHGF
jgi:hypothetical protein